MQKDLFNEMTASITEAGKIRRGEVTPSRMFHCRAAAEDPMQRGRDQRKGLDKVDIGLVIIKRHDR